MRNHPKAPEKRRACPAGPEANRAALGLFLVFGLAVSAMYFAQAIPARAVRPGTGHVVDATESIVLAPPSERGRKPKVRGLDYMVPRTRPARLASSYLDALRDAGLLRAYSVPPDRLVFAPDGRSQFLPLPPLPGAPRAPEVVSHGDRSKPRVALTFDDGYSGMKSVMDLLLELRVPATFFPTGGAGAGHKSLILEAVRRGFEIGNHTYTHTLCTRLPSEIIAGEITGTDALVKRISGSGTAAYFRPPAGVVDPRVELVAAGLGYEVVLWSRDTIDWSPASTPDQVIARATDGVRDGDIILMHTQGPHTLEVLPEVVKRLRAAGFELTTVSGILAGQ
jgi:peptidoglycan/xylan/chitin deacetylase (PgdA/CDA1 family)